MCICTLWTSSISWLFVDCTCKHSIAESVMVAYILALLQDITYNGLGYIPVNTYCYQGMEILIVKALRLLYHICQISRTNKSKMSPPLQPKQDTKQRASILQVVIPTLLSFTAVVKTDWSSSSNWLELFAVSTYTVWSLPTITYDNIPANHKFLFKQA